MKLIKRVGVFVALSSAIFAELVRGRALALSSTKSTCSQELTGLDKLVIVSSNHVRTENCQRHIKQANTLLRILAKDSLGLSRFGSKRIVCQGPGGQSNWRFFRFCYALQPLSRQGIMGRQDKMENGWVKENCRWAKKRK